VRGSRSPWRAEGNQPKRQLRKGEDISEEEKAIQVSQSKFENLKE